jgi:hypothetical protein
MVVQQARAGAWGCDTDTKLTATSAAALCKAGIVFCIRYLSLGSENPGDLNQAEVAAVLGAGLALMAVQHVREPGWLPSLAQGASDGSHAAGNAVAAGMPAGATVWLDLEGVSTAAPADVVIAYCNAWNSAVAQDGYDTGLYVGAMQPLDENQLFSLNVQRYWRSQSLVPNVARRGYCMYQAYPSQTLAGISVDFNMVSEDALGGLPRWAIAA